MMMRLPISLYTLLLYLQRGIDYNNYMDFKLLLNSYKNASKRLFLLDYDGTLVDLMLTPPEAAPSAELMTLLQQLTSDPKNTVVIISGRDHQTLDTWLGKLPIGFATEHGMFYKEVGGTWQETLVIDDSWKAGVHDIMQGYVAELPGSILEDKTNALAWHCRAAADEGKATQLEDSLVAELIPYVQGRDLRLIHGSKVVEVLPSGVDKGKAAGRWLSQGSWDFILAAGDDTTDEDLFKVLPESAWTFKIGSATTLARSHLDSVAQLLSLLNNL